MSKVRLEYDEASILQRFDRSSPEALLQSIAMELARLGQANALLTARLAAMDSVQAMADRIASGAAADFATDYPSQVRIDAANSFLGGLGFYGVEHDQNGRPTAGRVPSLNFRFSSLSIARPPGVSA